MRTRFHRACELVFKLHRHRDPLIKRTITNLVPILANYDPQYFADEHLGPVMSILTEQLRRERDRATRESSALLSASFSNTLTSRCLWLFSAQSI